MTNLSDTDGIFVVVVNDENLHSACPAALGALGRWHVAHHPDTRRACLDYVERTWTDMWPASLTKLRSGPANA